MNNPNEAMMKMVEEVVSRASAAGFSINGAVEHFPETETTTEYVRITANASAVSGSFIEFTFVPPDAVADAPECAVNYYGTRGNYMCMVYTSNIDAVLINYGRALNALSTDAIGSLKNEG